MTINKIKTGMGFFVNQNIIGKCESDEEMWEWRKIIKIILKISDKLHTETNRGYPNVLCCNSDIRRCLERTAYLKFKFKKEEIAKNFINIRYEKKINFWEKIKNLFEKE